jgi:hypothetical protein
MRRHANAVERRFRGIELVAIASVENDMSAGASEPCGDGESETAAGAGDQRAPVTQIERVHDRHRCGA